MTKIKNTLNDYTSYNNTVWQYWEKKDNKDIPGYISYCMDRVKKQANKDELNYVLITPENLNEYITLTDLPKHFYDLKEIAHRADFIRIYVLYHYGGMWIDADAFAKDSFIQLFNDLNDNQVVYWDKKDKKEPIENSLLLSRKNSNIMKVWYDKIKNILDHTTNIEWTEIGGSVFRNILDTSTNKENKVYDQSATCFPVHWSDAKRFFESGDSDFLIRKNQPIVMLYNHIFPKDFKNLNDKEFNDWLTTSDTVLADLMRKY
jgi:mannosyltransferase OCH1-like enzyme